MSSCDLSSRLLSTLEQDNFHLLELSAHVAGFDLQQDSLLYFRKADVSPDLNPIQGTQARPAWYS